MCVFNCTLESYRTVYLTYTKKCQQKSTVIPIRQTIGSVSFFNKVQTYTHAGQYKKINGPCIKFVICIDIRQNSLSAAFRWQQITNSMERLPTRPIATDLHLTYI